MRLEIKQQQELLEESRMKRRLCLLSSILFLGVAVIWYYVIAGAFVEDNNSPFLESERNSNKRTLNMLLLNHRNLTKCNTTVDVLVNFINSQNNLKFQNNFYNFIVSLLTRTVCDINLYITTDDKGREVAENILENLEKEINWVTLPRRIYLSVDVLSKELVKVTKPMQVSVITFCPLPVIGICISSDTDFGIFANFDTK